MLETLLPNLFCYVDTCRVYILRLGDSAVLIDYGSGSALEALPALGIQRVDAVLLTHHHRDQCQGLNQCVPPGARIYAPESELHLLSGVEAMWQSRGLMLNYDMRSDRFSLLEPIGEVEPLKDYRTYRFGDLAIEVIPTPGHTTGSASYAVTIDHQRVVFCGDLIASPGKVWSLEDTQWTYNGGEGLALTAASLSHLLGRAPDLLLPSHGEAMAHPAVAIQQTIERLGELIALRQQNPRLFHFLDCPYENLTEHLLLNRTSMANSYALLSRSGKALVIDFGYDFICGIAPGADRSVRRPWLFTLPYLKQGWGVTQVDVVLPTHYHDDHLAGFNLLREVEGAQVWCPQTFADILEHPTDYNLPCLWFDPIPVDRALPLGEPVEWQEYRFTLYPLPGHTRYAVAILLEVDGKRALFVGDEFREEGLALWNYTYQNRVRPGDWSASADLIQTLAPDLILSGHLEPIRPDAAFYAQLASSAQALECLHRELLGNDTEAVEAVLSPYQAQVKAGECVNAVLKLQNMAEKEKHVEAHMALPQSWRAEPERQSALVGACSAAELRFTLYPPDGQTFRRARAAAELTVDGRPLGQVCEMLISAS